MGGYKIDLTGKVFGRLTVLEFSHNRDNTFYWKCLCECGNVTYPRGTHLKRGVTTSCGCYNKDKDFKHGMCFTKIYNTWCGLRKRCTNPKDAAYKRYGGRGIKVSDDWNNSFDNFRRDMGDPPTPKHSLDRIDNNGDYCKENCRWATMREQSNNKQNNHRIMYMNETKTISEWSRHFDLAKGTIRDRLKRGFSLDKVFSKVNLQNGRPVR